MESQDVMEPRTPHPEISAAIDFGTSNCAVAYSYASDKDNVIVINNWHDGVETHGKIPTAILFDENQQFVAFGNKAIEKYKEVASNGEAHAYYFFQNFKMKLYQKNINEDIVLEDAVGKTMKALDVFISAISHLREFLLEELVKRGGKQEELKSNISWVITVPTIWNNAAKQFMRLAAESAGCLEIKIGLESEAASIFCQKNPNIIFKKILQEKEGAKYLVIDIGGGTLDITAHQYMGTDHIKEIYRASGENLGGNLVEELFERHLENVFGIKKIIQIKQQNPDAWIQLIKDFEKAKKTASTSDVDDDELVYLNSSKDCSWGWKTFKIKTSLSFSKNDLNLKKDGRIFFSQSVLFGIINDITTRINEYVSNLLTKEKLKEIDAALLIGGFAKSSFIRDALRTPVENNIPLIEPECSELCVVKGAVLFGWKRDIIRSRKSRYTYGLGIVESFSEEEHDESKAFYNKSGEKLCDNIFLKLVTIDDDLQIDKCIENVFVHGNNEESITSHQLFCSKDPNPKYIDDEGVSLIGKIEIPNSINQRGKEMIQSVFFGDTDISLQITDKTTGKSYHDRFNFFINEDVKFLD